MRDVVEVAHLMGPMWSVAGRSVVVPAGENPAKLLLTEVAARVEGQGPWFVRVVDGSSVLDLVLGADGSVSSAASIEGAGSSAGCGTPHKAGKSADQRPGRATGGLLTGLSAWVGQWWWVVAIVAAIAAIVTVAVLFVGSQLTAGSEAPGELMTVQLPVGEPDGRG